MEYLLSFAYNVTIENAEALNKNIKNKTYNCPSCLEKDNFEIELLEETGGYLVTCQTCAEKTLGIPKNILGIGNTAELSEYESVHAEWYIED